MNFFYRYIDAKYLSSKDKEGLHLQIFLSVMCIIAAQSCSILIIYSLYIDIFIFVIISTAGVLAFLFGLLLNRAGKTRVASFVYIFSMTALSLLATHFFGISSNAQWLIILALLPALLYFDFTVTQKICIVLVMPILINLQMILPTSTDYLMENSVFLKYYYANATMLGTILVLILNQIISSKISELRKKDLEAYIEMSHIDPLTKLNNRRYAELFFNQLRRRNKDDQCIFCMIDIDNFKKINDTYGHDTGDIVIKFIADVLRQNTRQTDLKCRWGGEEFLVVMYRCNAEMGQKILEKIRNAVEDAVIESSSGNIRVTITGGAMVLTDYNIEAAMEDCDKKLYEAKHSGKNKIVF
jgi:diguanylate cyclase (GGDEF)-like protein